MGSIIYKTSAIALALSASTMTLGQLCAPLIDHRHKGVFQGKGQRKANKANRWR